MTISLKAALAILAHLVAFGRVADHALYTAYDTNTSSMRAPIVACHRVRSPEPPSFLRLYSSAD